MAIKCKPATSSYWQPNEQWCFFPVGKLTTFVSHMVWTMVMDAAHGGWQGIFHPTHWLKPQAPYIIKELFWIFKSIYGWMASLTQWTWVWVDSGSWWWTGRPGVLWFTGSQRVRHDWATELNWTDGYWLWVFLKNLYLRDIYWNIYR